MYRKIVRLLVEDWDAQRSIERASAYAAFEPDRKIEFLERIAFELQNAAFSHHDLQAVYRGIHADFGLARAEALRVAREVESHTGLIVQVAFDSFEFAHKSLKEYLAAEYIVRLPTLPDVSWCERFPSECAIAVSISGESGRYFAAMVFRVFVLIGNSSATEAFLRRVLLEQPDLGVNAEAALALLVLDDAVDARGAPDDAMRRRITTLMIELASTQNLTAGMVLALNLFERGTGAGNRRVLTLADDAATFGYPVPPYLKVSASLVQVIGDNGAREQPAP